MTAKEMERELLALQEEYAPEPTPEQRAHYRELWERWLRARGRG